MAVPEWNPEDKTPYVYVRLAEHMEALIAAGRFPQGSMLPNERELVAEFGVSIDTVRRATAELRKRGRVVTYPSRGTYVTSLLETRAYPGTPRGTRVNRGARR